MAQAERPKQMTAEQWDVFCADLKSLRHRAMEGCLFVTARRLTQAVRASGWERAGESTKAFEQSAEDRP